MEIPKAVEINPTYENFEARCPICKHWNIFNRASEIKSFKLISELTVDCQNGKCKEKFWIDGDFINPAWQMLILDCEMLKQQKRYSYCILNLAQAFEMYFALYFRVELLYKPYGIEKSYDSNRFHNLSDLLFDTTRKWTYFTLRNTFLNFLIQKIKCNNLAESESVIKNLQSYSLEPTNKVLKTIKDQELYNILLELKNSEVSTKRNDVVHKYAYRPKLEVVEDAVEETFRILYGLDNLLGVLSEQTEIYEVI